jgi:phosphatidylglycerophosphatase A
MRRLGVWLATSLGAGYFPVAPGTAGSAVGLVIYLLTFHWSAGAQIALVAIVSVVGVWAASEGAKHFQRDDPGQVVIDEVAGQLLTLLLTGAGVGGAVIGFFVFRVLDIFKPFPARRLEHLHGGFGIMADDLMVAVYGNILMRGFLIAAARLGLMWAT